MQLVGYRVLGYFVSWILGRELLSLLLFAPIQIKGIINRLRFAFGAPCNLIYFHNACNLEEEINNQYPNKKNEISHAWFVPDKCIIFRRSFGCNPPGGLFMAPIIVHGREEPDGLFFQNKPGKNRKMVAAEKPAPGLA